MKLYHYLLLVLSAFSLEVNAQIVTDRPDQTESSSTVPLGALQVESGFLISYEGEGAANFRNIVTPNNLFRYGLTSKFEIRLVNQYESFKVASISQAGISDLQLGFKAQLFKKEGSKTEVAFLSHVILPTGSSGFTADNYGSINKLSISHVLSESVGLGYNFGYDNFGVGSGNLTYSLSLGKAINDKWSLYLEPYGQITEFQFFVLNFDTGITYLLNNNLQLDFSFGSGITDKMNYIAIGCSWLLEK